MIYQRDPADAVRLWEKCRKGDQQAWAELIESYQNLVYSIPSRMKLSQEDCADVFQATFVALSANKDRLNSAVALPKWLAVTAAREALRIKRLSSRYSNEAALGEMKLDEVVEAEELAADATSIKAVEANEVRRAVQQLPDRCRSLLTALFFDEEAPYAEVADRLGIPVGAIGPTRARCLEKLRGLLQEADFFE